MNSYCQLTSRGSDLCADYSRSAWQPTGTLPFADQQQVLFYFMSRFTCSRCWYALMALAHFQEQLRAQQTMVVVVGDGDHIQAAAHLAEELAIPFPLVADNNGTLRRLYGLPRPGRCAQSGVFALVDGQGRVCFYEHNGTRSAVDQLAHILDLNRQIC
jgi:peroxiredoxin